MRTISVDVSTADWCSINLGYYAENEATQVIFDISSLIDLFGSGSAVLLHKRATDTNAYPVTVDQEGGTVTWTVTNIDTNVVGYGKCELYYYVDETLAKTIVFSTYVTEDIGTTGSTPPDPYETWVETLTELGAETLQNAQDAAQSASDAEGYAEAAEAAAQMLQNVSATATTLAPDQDATASYDDGVFSFGIPKGVKGDPGQDGSTPHFSVGTTTTLSPGSDATVTQTGTDANPVLNFGIPQGVQGNPGTDGVSPTVSTQAITGGTEVTITDKNGNHVFDVMNGQDAVVDPTLSIEGEAADAKATGDAISALNSAISETCTDATGLQLVDEEKLNTIYTEAFLNTLDRIFTELPQDDSLEDIYDEIVIEVSLLDQLYREVAAAVNA